IFLAHHLALPNNPLHEAPPHPHNLAPVRNRSHHSLFHPHTPRTLLPRPPPQSMAPSHRNQLLLSHGRGSQRRPSNGNQRRPARYTHALRHQLILEKSGLSYQRFSIADQIPDFFRCKPKLYRAAGSWSHGFRPAANDPAQVGLPPEP